MKLVINKKYNKSFVENTCFLGTSMLSLQATHMYIASHVWESIVIELDDVIPSGVLNCMKIVSSDIKVVLPENITDKTVHLLTELYPDKAGAIRRSYMTGTPISKVVEECLA